MTGALSPRATPTTPPARGSLRPMASRAAALVATAAPPSGVHRGEVVRAPDDETDRLRVTVAGFPGQPHQAAWAPRDGGGFPAAEDECVVLIDDGGDAWVPLWWSHG
jgi:hypothetical protein